MGETGANVDHWYLDTGRREKMSSPGPVASVGPVATSVAPVPTVCPSPGYEREEEDLAKAASLKADECEGIV